MKKTRQTDFRDLEVWQKCQALRKQAWTLTRRFPKEEKYRLADQVSRAVRSATSCIAEGYGRFHFQENIQFCRQARGSLYELIDHFETAAECGYLDTRETNELVRKIMTAIKILNGYLRYLKGRKTGDSNKTV